MKRITLLIIVALTLSLMFVGAKSALAVNEICTDGLTGAAGNGECIVNTLHDLGVGGFFAVDRALHITGPGELRVNGGATLDLLIAGNAGPAPTEGLLMDGGGKITGNTTGTTGVGATLNITVTTGDVLLKDSGTAITADNPAGAGCGSGHAGVINLTANGLKATIKTEDGTTISASSNTCSAGAINISAPNKGAIDIDGNVLAWGKLNSSGSGTANSGSPIPTGGTQGPAGGPIFITAACNLTISDTGVVSSFGNDPGADLVHLQGGCDVLINGLVESTGSGHAIPGNPPNSCSNVIPHAGSVRRNPATRPGKPFNSTACVEVWAGDSLTITRDIRGHNGEINADLGPSGGPQGTSWIDLFARGDITILGSASNANATNAAVHANGYNGNTDTGGVVTVKSRDGKVILNGLALQANGTVAGGTVDAEAKLNVDLTAIDGTHSDGIVQAVGRGGPPAAHGGHIIIYSQNDILAGAASNLNVTGHPNTAADDGTVVLQVCAAHVIDFPPGGGPGTITPADAIVTRTVGPCPPPVSFAGYLYEVNLPFCPCVIEECVPVGN